jgi:hypothetical protein
MIKRELAVLTLGAMLLLTGCGNRVETVYVENTDTEKAVSQEEATLTSDVTTQTVTEKSSAITEVQSLGEEDLDPETAALFEEEKKKLDSLLEAINEGIQPGTAGSTLKAVPYTCDLLDWCMDTALGAEEISAEVVSWMAENGIEPEKQYEEDSFYAKMSLAGSTYLEITGEHAEDFMVSAGYEDEKYPCSEKAIANIETIMLAAGVGSEK